MSDLYDELGVGKDASQDDIKKAYRKKAFKAHPDRGGSTEAMQRLALAYKVLGSEERRQRYDNTGQTDTAESAIEAYIRGEMTSLILTCINEVPDPATVDILFVARNLVKERIANCFQQRSQIQMELRKLERAVKRFRRKKKDQRNFMREIVENHIKSIEQALRNCDENIDKNEALLAAVEEYEYDVDDINKYFAIGDGRVTIKTGNVIGT